MTATLFQERRNAYAAGAATFRRKRPSQSVAAAGHHGMSSPRGMPRTPMPATGLPSGSVTRPSMVAGGFCAIRFAAAVGFGGVAQATSASVTAAIPATRSRIAHPASGIPNHYVIIPA